MTDEQIADLRRKLAAILRRQEYLSGQLTSYVQQGEMLDTFDAFFAAQPNHSGDGGETLNPVEPSALASSIAEVEALSLAEDRDLTVSEMESMMLVLLELRRLRAVAVPQGGDERTVLLAKEFAVRYAGASHENRRIAEQEFRAALAQKAVPMSAPAESSVPVNFLGIDPLEISSGAHLPMIPESWRCGFRKTANGYDFSFQDDGPLVAWDAVKDIVAQKVVPIAVEPTTPSQRDCIAFAEAKTIPPAPIASTEEAAFQSRVQPWMLACFGADIAADKMERNCRFFEEATEAVQANGMTRSEAHQLVDYTFDRPVGELHQEVGGVMVTLAALCLASGIDMHEAGEVELARIWTKVEAIRAKQAAKPKHSPLPEHTHPAAAQPSRAKVLEQAAQACERQECLRDRKAADALEALIQDIEDLKHDNASMLDSLTRESVARCEAEDRLEIATQELKNIANADTVEWDDPSQYEAWAKSRARHTLAQIGKEPT